MGNNVRDIFIQQQSTRAWKIDSAPLTWARIFLPVCTATGRWVHCSALPYNSYGFIVRPFFNQCERAHVHLLCARRIIHMAGTFWHDRVHGSTLGIIIGHVQSTHSKRTRTVLRNYTNYYQIQQYRNTHGFWRTRLLLSLLFFAYQYDASAAKPSGGWKRCMHQWSCCVHICGSDSTGSINDIF